MKYLEGSYILILKTIENIPYQFSHLFVSLHSPHSEQIQSLAEFLELFKCMKTFPKVNRIDPRLEYLEAKFHTMYTQHASLKVCDFNLHIG
jgi:hypothetical protein